MLGSFVRSLASRLTPSNLSNTSWAPSRLSGITPSNSIIDTWTNGSGLFNNQPSWAPRPLSQPQLQFQPRQWSFPSAVPQRRWGTETGISYPNTFTNTNINRFSNFNFNSAPWNSNVTFDPRGRTKQVTYLYKGPKGEKMHTHRRPNGIGTGTGSNIFANGSNLFNGTETDTSNNNNGLSGTLGGLSISRSLKPYQSASENANSPWKASTVKGTFHDHLLAHLEKNEQSEKDASERCKTLESSLQELNSLFQEGLDGEVFTMDDIQKNHSIIREVKSALKESQQNQSIFSSRINELKNDLSRLSDTNQSGTGDWGSEISHDDIRKSYSTFGVISKKDINGNLVISPWAEEVQPIIENSNNEYNSTLAFYEEPQSQTQGQTQTQTPTQNSTTTATSNSFNDVNYSSMFGLMPRPNQLTMNGISSAYTPRWRNNNIGGRFGSRLSGTSWAPNRTFSNMNMMF